MKEQRARFYEGQYLDAADLTAVVSYARSQHARALLGPHTWGIALGLELREVPGPNNTLDVFVQPGYAWDGFGRPIVVSEPAKVPAALFSRFDDVAGPPVVVPVWIQYDENLTKPPRPGFESCDAVRPFGAVRETFRITAGPRLTIADRRDPIDVAGREVDAAQALRTFDPAAPELADASVPFQLLPDEDQHRRWLIPLGVVRWEPGSPGRFVAREDADLDRSALARRYCGAVTESVEAPAGHVRVHDRRVAYRRHVTEELLWVEGELRVDGHARLYGSRLEFVRNHAESPRAPFHVLRRDDSSAGRIKLQVVIGDQHVGANRLAIGPKTGEDPTTHEDVHAEDVVVTDAGKVGVGVPEPKARLHVTEDGVQIGASTTPEDNFHVQSNTDGPRGLRVYNRDVGSGAHLLTITHAGGVGVGTTEPTNVIDARGNLGIRQNALYLSGGPGWSSLTYNAHHDPANGTWIFPNPSRPAVTVEMDDAGGHPRFEVWSTPPGDNQTWRSRFRIDGHSGNIRMGAGLRVVDEIEFGSPARRPVAAAEGLRVVAGVVSASGTVISGGAFSATRLDEGRYQITFDEPFPETPSVIVTKVFGSPAVDAGTGVQPRENAIVDELLLGSVIVATSASGGSLDDSAFCFMAMGRR